MKIRYPFLLATLLIGALITVLFTVKAINAQQAFALAILGQFAILSKSRMSVRLCMTMIADEQLGELTDSILSVKKSLEQGAERNTQIMERIKKLEDGQERLLTQTNDLRRRGLGASSGSELALGRVSDECARYLGAIALATALRKGQLETPARDFATSQIRAIFGSESKSALTSSDIPLPTAYSGQVVELVGLYGMARKYGTVFPLSAGQMKLPKLTTDPTFGLIAQSGTVTEKSPQTGWVTFNPEKFGGLVRVPSEIDEDSIVNIGQFVARYAARNIARVEDVNFFVGTGADSGVNGAVAGLTVSTITNAKVTQMATGKTATSQATLANLRVLRAVPDAPIIRTGAYYFHPSMEQLLSSFNTAGDRPYNPNAQLAQASQAQPFIIGPTLDGYPVRWVDVLPAYSATPTVSTVFGLFGDLSFQYLGVRGGIRFDTSVEAAFATDEILIRALERFTIGLMANGAVAGIETAAS